MLKKLITVGGAIGLLLILLFGRDVASYITTSANWVGDSVREQIPVEFELDRARRMIGDLTPEIRDNMYVIAREEIEIQRLSEQISALTERQAAAKRTLTHIQREIQSGKSDLTVGNTVYTSVEATDIAEQRFENYKTHDVTLQNLQRTLEARHTALVAARKQLDSMIAAKQQLLAEVASLEARQRMNEVARTANNFSFDESHLARTRDLIREIETRVKIDERLAETEIQMMDAVDFDERKSGDVLEKIAEYFEVAAAPSDALAEVKLEELTADF